MEIGSRKGGQRILGLDDNGHKIVKNPRVADAWFGNWYYNLSLWHSAGNQGEAKQACQQCPYASSTKEEIEKEATGMESHGLLSARAL